MATAGQQMPVSNELQRTDVKPLLGALTTCRSTLGPKACTDGCPVGCPAVKGTHEENTSTRKQEGGTRTSFTLRVITRTSDDTTRSRAPNSSRLLPGSRTHRRRHLRQGRITSYGYTVRETIAYVIVILLPNRNPTL